MDDLQYMDDDECYDGGKVRTFTSLEELSLDRLPNLEGLLKVEGSEMFLRLSNVTIRYCPKLRWSCLLSVKYLNSEGCKSELLKSIASMSSFTTLYLEDGDKELASFPPEGMLRNLTCLQTLEINSFPELKELLSELFNLIALEDLEIRSCGKLESLFEQGWEGLRSLRTLIFYHCRGLRCFPDGIQHLTSFEKLEFNACGALESLPEQGWEGLCSLRTLRFYSCIGFRSLPDDIQHLTSLEKLEFSVCGALESLLEQGREGLRSLRTLSFCKCGELGSLLDGIQHLTSLDKLEFSDCKSFGGRHGN